MAWPEGWRRWGALAALAALSATTATVSRWLRNAVDARSRVRVASRPAAMDPAGARAQQRLADTPLWPAVEGRLAGRALAPFRVRPTLRPLCILEVDHGPGGVAVALAARAPRDALVVATDSQAGMGELARERAARRRPRAGLAFVRARPERLPFLDGAFDLVVSAGALHQWRDPEGAFGELRRGLRPAGRYLVLDLRRDVAFGVWLVLRAVQALLAPGALRALDEPSASVRAAYSRPEAEWLAARGGLPDLDVRQGAAWLMIEMRAGSPAERSMGPVGSDNPISPDKENRQ